MPFTTPVAIEGAGALTTPHPRFCTIERSVSAHYKHGAERKGEEKQEKKRTLTVGAPFLALLLVPPLAPPAAFSFSPFSPFSPPFSFSAPFCPPFLPGVPPAVESLAAMLGATDAERPREEGLLEVVVVEAGAGGLEVEVEVEVEAGVGRERLEEGRERMAAAVICGRGMVGREERSDVGGGGQEKDRERSRKEVMETHLYPLTSSSPSSPPPRQLPPLPLRLPPLPLQQHPSAFSSCLPY